jgi:hypothetical protein
MEFTTRIEAIKWVRANVPEANKSLVTAKNIVDVVWPRRFPLSRYYYNSVVELVNGDASKFSKDVLLLTMRTERDNLIARLYDLNANIKKLEQEVW